MYKREEIRIPKVSIGLPVYNGEKYINVALDSILRQDFEDFELIISDNASNDNTEGICRSYAEKDSRIRYYRFEQNTGAANNFNNVYKLSRGKYFKWAAYDDECYPQFLSRSVAVLDNAPDSVVMAYPWAELINEEGTTLRVGLDRIESRDSRPHRRLAKVVWSLTLCDPLYGLIKTNYLHKTHLIGPFFGSDIVLLGELAMLGEIREVDEILFRLRAHSQRSIQAMPNARALATWLNPSSAGKLFILPAWEQMVWGMLRAVWNFPLQPAEKSKCYFTVLGVHYWKRFRNAGGLVKRKLKACIAR